MKYNLTQDLVKLSIHSTSDPTILLLDTHVEETHINPKGAMKHHSLMWEVRGSLSVQRSRNGSNLWMHTMDYYAAVRSNTLHAHLATERI